MVDADVMYFQSWVGSSGMQTPVIQFCPCPVQDITLKLQVKTASELFIGAIAALVQANDSYVDLDELTMAGDETATALFIVLDTPDNIAQLKEDNDVYAATKALFFAAGSMIGVAILIPGLIVEVVLVSAEDAIALPGIMTYTAAAGKVKLEDGCTYLNNLGKVFCKVIVSEADERILILVTH